MNSMAKVLLIGLVTVVGGALLIGGCVYSGYNKAITLDENVKASWAQVENQLQRRFNLIPNLVETVKGVAAHENDIFMGIARARESYFKADSVADKAKATGGFESALSRLLVLRETYPDLKANQSFRDLQIQLEGTENRLAVERKRYNDAVRSVNTFCRKFPGRYYCSFAGVEKSDFFEIEETARELPKVDFSNDGEADTSGGSMS